MRSVLLLAAIAIGLPQSIPSPATPGAQTADGTVRVFVHRAGTSEGIPNASVTLTPLSRSAPGTPLRNFTASTDSAGTVLLRDLPNGDAGVQVQCDGYMSIQAQQSLFQSVTVDDSKKDQKVDAPMLAGATISGRVLDEQGQPMAGVEMRIFKKGYVDGRPGFTNVSPVSPAGTSFGVSPGTTNDRGEYRLFWFGPGDYYIQEQAPYSPPRQEQWDNRPPLPVKESYYPGTSDVTKALPVTVKAGEERTAVDFNVPYARGITISGVVVNPLPGGQTLPNGQVYRAISNFSLIPHGSPLEPMLFKNTILEGPNSDSIGMKFELRDVAPGSYDLYPLFSMGARGQRVADATARTPIEARDRDIDNLRIVLKPNTDLNGRVIFDGDTPPTGFSSIRLQLKPEEVLPASVVGGLRQAVSTTATPDAKTQVFVFSGVMEAAFSVVVTGVPSGNYVSDIRLGSASIYDSATVQVHNGLEDSLDIIIHSGGGSIEGTVQGDVVQAAVLLIPSGARHANASLYKKVFSDPSGKFTISGIAPGEYRLIAMESFPAGNAEQDPDFIAGYAAHAATVTVGAGLKTGVQLMLSKP